MPDDNRWENLRESDSHQNSCNRRKQENNTSGYKGVSWRKRDEKWETKIQINGRTLHPGASTLPPECMIWWP
jgi:hypothetical protein